MLRSPSGLLPLLVVLGILGAAFACSRAEPSAAPAKGWDSGPTYLDYLRRAPEFQTVQQAPPSGRWDTWLYMPWRYRWTIGTGEEGGRFCQRYGINGGVTDHGEGPFAWLERWHLRFYNDHTAGKGDLYLQPGSFAATVRDGRALRPRPLDAALLARLQETVAARVRAVRSSPQRVAYALDDETSWGSFVRPLPWRVNADDGAYARWLTSYYGGSSPPPRWVTPDDVLGELGQPLGEIDLSPLLDRMTYNDSVWANFLGALVERCHREDPATPCGIVGAQGPSLWGGYDYAKLAKKVQFVEAYDVGSAPEILRSFDRAGAVPRVTTHFHDESRGPGNDSWLAWHYFAHGSRGMIGWVDDGWFANGRPRYPQPWLDRFAPTLRELGGVQGPKMAGARSLHDGIAIYYSHPSIQVSWCLDAEAHHRTWPNRLDDARLGTSHNVRKAWELLLADAGLRYDFLAYDQVALHGVPGEYKVLILPACYALSDAEARRIAEFAQGGGTVIADFACGLFDPHGRGRQRGALDGLFGVAVAHNGHETRADLFAGKLWVETDQDAGYGFKRWRDLFATLKPRLERGYAVAERRLVVGAVGTGRAAGRGRAVYLNLSPQRYLQYRQEGTAGEAERRPFLTPILQAGVAPWITVTSDGRRPAVPLEATYWSKGGRTLVFVLQNVPIASSPTGGGGPEGLAAATIPLEIRLAAPVRNVVDERTGRRLPDGDRFSFRLDTAEAVLFSFAGGPPKK
ncbi:MAG TPA: beta-galactosidase trimerization domain-containing protein [Thermoanaerobaculia bacterium]|nr:beta-galactosidase trimerization domain-containing protein [Thermoanaerobaculia bacterium]